MPGCILHVAGVEFDPEAFLANSTFDPYTVWHRGEPVALKGPRSARIYEWSGFRCDVSKTDGNLNTQLADAIQFLTSHRADFERLATQDKVEDCRLDFGFDCRLSDQILMQGEYLPVEFLQLVGELRIAVALSLYPPMLADKSELT